ncbi:type II toxin-antitoxin system VapC family toxin [Dyadobacter sp. 676]|uniref:Type II toxin-antitoxin system VapC family toxin n=1 Tax=Dyadobacter sp. 676 TaxID=3088362 RepID=A0AAU8FSU7_9BACT
MTIILKKGQALEEIFPAAKWAQLFPASRSAPAGKRLNAGKFVGIIQQNCDPLATQKQCNMSGTKMLLDTDIVLRLFEGDADLGTAIQGIEPYLSFITELELLGNKYISREYQEHAEMFVTECYVIDLNESIKEIARYVQWEYSLKLPDALVASTAMCLGIPLLSAERDFEKVKELIFVLYQ